MRVSYLFLLLMVIVSCSESLVEVEDPVHQFKMEGDHQLTVIAHDLSSEQAAALVEKVKRQQTLQHSEVDQVGNNEKSWKEIEFVPLFKKKGFFWDHVEGSNIVYQSYAVHYIDVDDSGSDMTLVHQFPVQSYKDVAPFLLSDYNLADDGWKMTCVRARLYGTDAVILSKNLLVQNELRVFDKENCGLNSGSFGEINALTLGK